MFVQRVASALVFITGLVVLRVSVVLESWPALVVGIAVATTGLAWLVLGGSASSTPIPLRTVSSR